MDIRAIMEKLREKRPAFHSEADFQFALAWEIQLMYPDASIRLEYPPVNDPNKYIDIIVWIGNEVYPVELKHLTKLMTATVASELFFLKNHGAQDLGCYDCIKDICRLESFSQNIKGFRKAYAIWLTNDLYYLRPPTNPYVGYYQFSIHEGAVKKGSMSWGNNVGKGTTRGREQPWTLMHSYTINWHDYSKILVDNGIFKYAVIEVPCVDNDF